ncbi:MAG: hypothetical protein JXR97_00265, partial [Planctomycetes bacterium]|nr:hypothetical protein [Planctomycetota bacterium]
KNGVLTNEIRAEKADALGLSENKAKITLENVTIDIYDTSIATGGESDSGKRSGPPPLKMRILSDKGNYERRKGESGLLEDFVTLNENVRVFRFIQQRDASGKLKSVVHTTVNCDNATWNHTRQVLRGTGPVRVTQQGVVLTGEDFTYKMIQKSESDKEPSPEDKSGSKMSGWIEIERNVNMVMEQSATKRVLNEGSEKKDEKADAPKPSEKENSIAKDAKGKVEKTIVTCDGLASYDLEIREVQFQKNVVVTRINMVMRSDYLRVLMIKGQRPIKEIIAWSNVSIQGRDITAAAQPADEAKADAAEKKENKSYTALGDYARYTQDDEKLILTDRREGKLPVVRVGTDVISNILITFDTTDNKMNVLVASGDKGEANLSSPPEEGEGDVRIPTHVTFDKILTYDRNKGQAIFISEKEKVNLTRKDLNVKAEQIEVNMLMADGESADATQGTISTMIATGKVEIQRGEQSSSADRAEFDRLKRLVRLFGPPNPQVIEKDVYLFSGKTITTIQKVVEEGQPPATITSTTDPSLVIYPERKDGEPRSAADPDAVTIRGQDKMVSDESKNFIRFTKNVVAISEEFVLNSEVLDIVLSDEPVVKENAEGKLIPVLNEDGSVKKQKRVAMIDAHEKATLHWGKRHCKGYRIVRDLKKQIVIVYGNKETGVNAEVWEEDGNSFQAPVIVATISGDQIRASGPGLLTMPDDEGDNKARVHYEGTAHYVETSPEEGKVTFTKSVKMVRSDMSVTGDKMVAYLAVDKSPDKAVELDLTAPEQSKAKPRRLKNIDVEGHVVVNQTGRVAKGDIGKLVVLPAGDVITLQGSDKRMSDVRDDDGIHLVSPEIVVSQGRGIVTATGPGTVYITTYEKGVVNKGKKTNYKLVYEEKMIYNSLARKIKFYGNVKLYHQNINGRTDMLEVVLLDNPKVEDGGAEDSEKTQVSVKEMFAYGHTEFQRFEPNRKNVSDMDTANQPGKTIFTRSENAHYDVDKKWITLSGGPPRPTAIQQITAYDDHGAMDRSRDQMWADTLRMDVSTGKMWGPKARVKRVFLPKQGSFDFGDEQDN